MGRWPGRQGRAALLVCGQDEIKARRTRVKVLQLNYRGQRTIELFGTFTATYFCSEGCIQEISRVRLWLLCAELKDRHDIPTNDKTKLCMMMVSVNDPRVGLVQ
jgi:hypothetical protein